MCSFYNMAVGFLLFSFVFQRTVIGRCPWYCTAVKALGAHAGHKYSKQHQYCPWFWHRYTCCFLFVFFYIPVWVDVSLKTNMLMHSVHTAPHTPISVCILMLPGKCCLHQCRIKRLYCVSQERGQSALSLARSLHFQPEMTGCDVTEFEIILSVFTKRQVADPGLNFGSPGP